MSEPDEILATIHASTPRRWLAVGAVGFLGVLLIYTALATPPAVLGWTVFLLAIGTGALWLGYNMYYASARVIELTETELRDSTGEIIARIDDIESVDRGFFAFKPSNGFLLRTRTPAGPRRWLPGMWWRLGRRIGIGGVTPGHQSKFASEILSAMLVQRDQD